MGKSSNVIFIGSEAKINVHIEPIDDLHMSDYNFTISIYTSPSKLVDFKKEDAIFVDNDNYVICVDTSALSTGHLKCKVVAQIPDDDFKDAYRTEIAVIDTGIEIIKSV